MLLRNRVALYSIIGQEVLTYEEVWERLDNGKCLFMKVLTVDEIFYVRVKGETMRDVEYFALGYEVSNKNVMIVRTNYEY